jgi:hypothetical protein
VEGVGVSTLQQLKVDPGDPLHAAPGVELDERLARRSLRDQIARLERELCTIVADGFPHVGAAATGGLHGGPRLLGLEQLEQQRDELAGRVQELRRKAAQRAERERRARALLEAMKLEPGRYKFARLPVTELGQRGCGVWEVRPRMGLIGMLAGWWQLKLSSGCPLARGSRPRRGPARKHRASPRAYAADGPSSSPASSSRTWVSARESAGSASVPSGAGS